MSDLRNKISSEIQRQGSLPFAQFMHLCLYAHGQGYYERPLVVGKQGDFYTSVSVGPLYGELLAIQFADWLEQLSVRKNGAEGIQLVEAGAHDGRLAADILTYLESNRPEIFVLIEYWILEPSKDRENRQREVLSRFGTKMRWYDQFDSLPLINGIFFSNELLDAFPVHRLVWNRSQQKWLEYYVGWSGEDFQWETKPLSFAETEIGLPIELYPHLPDRFIFEVCRGAREWWERAAKNMSSGKMVAVDYGFTVEEFLRSGKINGTLRAYHQHHVSDNLLAKPGEQDLTAHVNFDAIKSAGENAGLKTDALISQAQFLTPIFERLVKSSATSSWPSKSIKQLQTLISPEHLGRFRVLVQSR